MSNVSSTWTVYTTEHQLTCDWQTLNNSIYFTPLNEFKYFVFEYTKKYLNTYK